MDPSDPIEEATLIHLFEASEIIDRRCVLFDRYSQQPLTGQVVVRYEGRILEKGPYKNGKREGLWVNYHNNGQLSGKGDYMNGKREGPWVSYKSDGTVNEKYTGSYKNDVKVD